MPTGEIERLEISREARRTFPLLATRSGTVIAKQVLDGTSVDPATELYTITDLSRVWLLADVYEADVAAVHVGQTARLDVQGLAAPIVAKVAFVPPTIDEPTRTLKVRYAAHTSRHPRRVRRLAELPSLARESTRSIELMWEHRRSGLLER